MPKTKTERHTKPSQNSGSGVKISYFFLAALSAAFVFVAMENKFIQDDAYISFRYIRNFVEGNGLVFNIGERVEGYTNLLWVLILSGLSFLKIGVESASQFLSVLFGIIVLFATYSLSETLGVNDSEIVKKERKSDKNIGEGFFDLIAPILLVFTASFIFWSVSGMETTMFISFSLLGLYYYIRSKDKDKFEYRYPLCFLFATLTRPEGLYFFGLVMIHKIIYSFVRHRSGSLKDLFSVNNIKTYLVYVVPVAVYFAVRYAYYGFLFPNTYYAKTGFSSAYLNSGMDYFMNFLSSYMLYGVMLLLPLFLFRRKELRFELALFYLIIVAFFLYTISVGGDVLKQNRFFLPVLPLIYILFAKSLTVFYLNLKIKSSQGIAFGVVAGIVAVLCFYYYSSQKEKLATDIASENGLVDKMKITGTWFGKKQQELGRPLNLAATTIGAVSYFAGPNVNVIDLLGLTDREIAHNPKIIKEISENEIGWKERNYNADYVMSRDPDYVYFSTGVKPSAYAERALFTTAEFNHYYIPFYIVDKASGSMDIVYKRKTDSEVKLKEADFPGNPNYSVKFVNMFNQAMNSSRDKSRAQVALGEFKQSLDMGPKGFGLPYQYMGDIYLQMGKKDLAIDSYKKAVQNDDQNVISHYQLYQLYSEKGDSSLARKSIDKIRKYNPDVLR
jgi:tetratricopeptide (TPR) repeat protein